MLTLMKGLGTPRDSTASEDIGTEQCNDVHFFVHFFRGGQSWAFRVLRFCSVVKKVHYKKITYHCVRPIEMTHQRQNQFKTKCQKNWDFFIQENAQLWLLPGAAESNRQVARAVHLRFYGRRPSKQNLHLPSFLCIKCILGIIVDCIGKKCSSLHWLKLVFLIRQIMSAYLRLIFGQIDVFCNLGIQYIV